MRKYYKKRGLIPSGFTFLPENANELCVRLRLIIHGEKRGSDSKKYDEETPARLYTLLGCKCVTTAQHKNLLIDSILIQIKFKLMEIYEVNRSILRYDYIRFSTAPSNQIDTPSHQIFIDIPKKVVI